jgi:hypothetical protein
MGASGVLAAHTKLIDILCEFVQWMAYIQYTVEWQPYARRCSAIGHRSVLPRRVHIYKVSIHPFERATPASEQMTLSPILIIRASTAIGTSVPLSIISARAFHSTPVMASTSSPISVSSAPEKRVKGDHWADEAHRSFKNPWDSFKDFVSLLTFHLNLNEANK